LIPRPDGGYNVDPTKDPVRWKQFVEGTGVGSASSRGLLLPFQVGYSVDPSGRPQ
jgi:hypothetical protein